MSEKSMMDELRRIARAYMQRKQAVDKVVAAEGGTRTKNGAMAVGEGRALARILDELDLTFGIDPWACIGEYSPRAAPLTPEKELAATVARQKEGL